MKLRPYQEEAINAVIAAMRKDRYVLLQAATGAGKTILFSELIRRWITEFQMRIAVVAHRRELISQARDKLLAVWPEGWMHVGIACASLVESADNATPVVIGSIQTLARRARQTPFHLVIIDEVHRVPPRAKGAATSQYHKFLDAMEALYPGLRVFGVTATPFRLGHGYIYGDKCKAGQINLFPNLAYSIGIADLQAQGYLVPIRAKEAVDVSADLKSVSTSGGDYNLGELSAMMSKPVHIQSAVQAYEQYGEDRHHCVIFCVSIAHAEAVMEIFRESGYASAVVHSEMPLEERDGVLSGFASGRISILANVGVLTEGWDQPHTDLIMLCRPTKSPGLFVQMVGRGTRIHPGKKDLLVLDLGSNFTTHGDFNNPKIIIPGENTSGKCPPVKICPNCHTVVPPRLLECPECGHCWDPPAMVEYTQPVAMKEVNVGPRPMFVDGVWLSKYISRAGNEMIKIELQCRNGGNIPVQLCHYWDIEGRASPWSGMRSRALWRTLADTEPPRDIQEAMERQGEIRWPAEIRAIPDGKYLKVAGW